MKENEFSNRKKLEQNIALWLTIIGVPFGVSVGLFSWMGLSLKQWLPVSLLISFAFGMVAYIFFLRADISDLKRENEDLKKNAKKK